ncbi:NAD-dependent epimerase/dehydratase family protein [Paracoccus endophyticus]|uniref:NAD-dependent epimerase/dehydratase family protein n=1 Tax=Paracoccus endophyticus TaxID=2233774 RepID=UPI000DD58117|nr:NAD-dependent epimerase/dehydratase family protein [Paracoccus endophyticus]
MTRRVLVTGGAGFVGSHLVDRLVADGEDVIVYDNLSAGKRSNIDKSARLIVGDILDTDLLADVVAQVDSIVHLAAIVSVQECTLNWFGSHKVNLIGAMNVFHAAARAGNIPVVYASSAAVYGNQPHGFCQETCTPMPVSAYAADKLGCEHQARAMAEAYGLPTVGLRFFNVYGARQDLTSPYAGVITKFTANRIANSPHTIFGQGLQSRDFIHVDDIVEGIIRAGSYLGTSRRPAVFNLCTGTATTVRQVADILDIISGREQNEIHYAAARHGDVMLSYGCLRLARTHLGFSTLIDIETGLRSLWSSMTGQEATS